MDKSIRVRWNKEDIEISKEIARKNGMDLSSFIRFLLIKQREGK